MRHLTAAVLLACATATNGQALSEDPPDPDLMQAWPAWLVGDHVKARRHFMAAARRGHPLGQYNLAMMLIHGEGGPRSADKACKLLSKAAARVELARSELKRCGRVRAAASPGPT